VRGEFYDELVEGLNEAIDFANGKDTGARVHTIALPVIDVAKISVEIGLSQCQGAKMVAEKYSLRR
jgi:putative transcriptional regulator